MIINLHPARKFAHHKKLLAADVNEQWRRYAIQALLEKDEYFYPEHSFECLTVEAGSSPAHEVFSPRF